MPVNPDVYVYSSDLINLMLDSFDEHEISSELCCETNTDADGIVSVVDPQCWCRVSWPEHVLTPRFNADATYHRADVSEIIPARLHAHSARRI